MELEGENKFFREDKNMSEISSNSALNSYAADYSYRTEHNKKTDSNKKADVTKEADKTTKKSKVSGRTIGDPVLSDKAQKYYEKLKAKYSNMDFILVSPEKKEEAESKKGMYQSSKELLVLIDSDKIEKMAEDEEYRAKYEGILNNAASRLNQMKDSLGSKADSHHFLRLWTNLLHPRESVSRTKKKLRQKRKRKRRGKHRKNVRRRKRRTGQIRRERQMVPVRRKIQKRHRMRIK